MPPPAAPAQVGPFAAYPENHTTPVYPQPTDPIPSLEDIALLEEQLRKRKEVAHGNYEKTIVDLAILGRIMDKVEKNREKKLGEKTKVEEKEVRLGSVKPPVTSLAVPEVQIKDASVTPRSSVQPRKVVPKGDNKKKRKRVDSDDDESYAPDRRTPPSPPPSYPKHKHPQHATSSNSLSKKPPRPEPIINQSDESYWRLPDRPTFVPSHPPPPSPPIAGPLHQQDVSIDLSDAKPPASQITADTFWKSVEPWIRDLGEEDVAAMSYIDDDPEPFLLPPLGRHYLDRWQEEEQTGYGALPAQRGEKGAVFPPTAGYDPTDLAESDWLGEDKSLGPVAERLVSALQPKRADAQPQPAPPAQATALVATASQPPAPGAAGGVNGALPPGEKKELIEAIAEELQVEDALAQGVLGELKVSAEELDVRIKRQLKELGLWTEVEPDYSAPEDDTLLAELRQCQRLLKDQMALNAARKYRLLKRCEDRLAYQDYVHQLERMDEQILSEWQKVSKKAAAEAKRAAALAGGGGHGRQASTSSAVGGGGGGSKAHPNGKDKDKKKEAERERERERERKEEKERLSRMSASHSPSVPPRTPADPSAPQARKPIIPEELLHAVRIRQRLVDELGRVFEQGEKECPGRFWGLPEGSLYAGLGVEEGRNVLRRVNVGHPALM